jgi:hypothetical protein
MRAAGDPSVLYFGTNGRSWHPRVVGAYERKGWQVIAVAGWGIGVCRTAWLHGRAICRSGTERSGRSTVLSVTAANAKSKDLCEKGIYAALDGIGHSAGVNGISLLTGEIGIVLGVLLDALRELRAAEQLDQL